MELVVGRLTPPFDEAAASAFELRGLLYAPEWRTCAESVARIDIFNLSSVNEFLGHAARLANLPDGASRIQETKFRQLPEYMYDVWLPFDSRRFQMDIGQSRCSAAIVY
jgi:hypothetical protein